MRCTLPAGDNAGVRGFRSDSYGDAFADVYDDWYADITDLDTTVGFVAGLAGPHGSVLELGVEHVAVDAGHRRPREQGLAAG